MTNFTFAFDQDAAVIPSPPHLVIKRLNIYMEEVPVCVHQFAHGELTGDGREPIPGWKCLRCGDMASEDEVGPA